MYYEEEKYLEMARSILPSKRRKTARFRKRRIARKFRHKAKQDLRRVSYSFRHGISEYDEEDAAALSDVRDFEGERKSELCWAVRERRFMDKLNHFERWARRKVQSSEELQEMKPSERVSNLVSKMPQGLIANHAKLHLQVHEEFSHPYRWVRVKGSQKKTEHERWLNGLSHALLADIKFCPTLPYEINKALNNVHLWSYIPLEPHATKHISSEELYEVQELYRSTFSDYYRWDFSSSRVLSKIRRADRQLREVYHKAYKRVDSGPPQLPERNISLDEVRDFLSKIFPLRKFSFTSYMVWSYQYEEVKKLSPKSMLLRNTTQPFVRQVKKKNAFIVRSYQEQWHKAFLDTLNRML